MGVTGDTVTDDAVTGVGMMGDAVAGDVVTGGEVATAGAQAVNVRQDNKTKRRIFLDMRRL